MPYQAFNTIGDLFSYIVANIGPNGNKEITGVRHQEVLVSTAYTLLNLMLILPDDTVMAFEPWNGSVIYSPGEQVIVRHQGKLWLFLKDADDTGTEPGTNATIWRELSSIELTHIRNRDQALDEGGPCEVTACELRNLLQAAPPDLAAVIGASNGFTPGYEHTTPMVPLVYEVSHSNEGPLVLDFNRAAIRVNASATVELTCPLYLYYSVGEWWVTVRNISNGTIRLKFSGGEWQAAEGVNVPLELDPGVIVMMRVTITPFGMVVIDCHSSAGFNAL